MHVITSFLHKYQTAILIILVIIFCFRLGSVLVQNKNEYLNTTFWKRFPQLKHAYINSQYVNKHPVWITDVQVNSYAAGAYITGTSPVLIAPDTPPLGRYLIGLSGLLFANENIITLVAGFFSLLFLYLVGMQIYKNRILAFLPLFFLSFEPIFINQFVYTPLLDIMQLAFLLGSVYFFNNGLLRKNGFLIHWIVSLILLGCFISTKFYATGTTVIGAYFMILLLHKKWKNMRALIVLSPIAVIVLLLTYMNVYSFKHYSFIQFLGIQKYVLLYHKSQLLLPFTIWPLLLFDRWYVWFGDKPILTDAQWQITWPLVALGSLLTVILYILKRIKHTIAVEALMSWIICYLLFFSIGQINSRYLIILLPVMYVVFLYGVREILSVLLTKYESRH